MGNTCSGNREDDIQAFAHFTYAASKRNFMILDLQGVYDPHNNTYILTDPAFISCVPGGTMYGPTDMGTAGVKAFFNNHRCNHMCRELIKPDALQVVEIQDNQLTSSLIPGRSNTKSFTKQQTYKTMAKASVVFPHAIKSFMNVS